MKERAEDVRNELGLLPDGRASLPQISRIEQIFARVLAPNYPSYDVDSVQGANFSEWCYTESCGHFMAFTQSVEINVRLTLGASEWNGVYDHPAPADRVAALADKWESHEAPVLPQGSKVWFPPGANMDYIADRDELRRAFDSDPSWLVKPHPITHDEQLQNIVNEFGKDRVLPSRASGMAVLHQAALVGFATCSELGVVAMMRFKPTKDFSLYEWECWGRLVGVYRAIRQSDETPAAIINRIFSCPWSGCIPLDMADDEAEERLTQYRDRTIELREHYKPITRPLPLRPGVDDV